MCYFYDYFLKSKMMYFRMHMQIFLRYVFKSNHTDAYFQIHMEKINMHTKITSTVKKKSADNSQELKELNRKSIFFLTTNKRWG